MERKRVRVLSAANKILQGVERVQFGLKNEWRERDFY